MAEGGGIGSFGSEHGLMISFCEGYIELPVFMKRGKFFHTLENYYLLKNNSPHASCRCTDILNTK
jgi:hypothetical protein